MSTATILDRNKGVFPIFLNDEIDPEVDLSRLI